MLKLRVFARYWLPALVWMVLIFTASGDRHSYEHSSRLFEPFLRWLFPRLAEARIHDLHETLRKGAHLTEYAILALLLRRAVGRSPENNRRRWSWPEVRLVLFLVMLYAATDEFHQQFVPTRTAMVSDVFLDTAGGAAGLLALWLLGRRQKYW